MQENKGITILMLLGVIIIGIAHVGHTEIQLAPQQQQFTTDAIGSCTDSDGGIDRFRPGQACIDDNDLGACVTDVCLDDESLIEYYCDGDERKERVLRCDRGCEGGRCVPDSDAVEEYFVFVSSQMVRGDLGGLDEADAICQSLAETIPFRGLPYKAWLSDSDTSASERLYHSDLPYKLLDGTVVAVNWQDLTDGELVNPIIMNEQRQILEAGVYTGTEIDGTAHSNNCNDWTTTQQGTARIGFSSFSNNLWTSAFNNGCGGSFQLYCIEQPRNP